MTPPGQAAIKANFAVIIFPAVHYLAAPRAARRAVDTRTSRRSLADVTEEVKVEMDDPGERVPAPCAVESENAGKEKCVTRTTRRRGRTALCSVSRLLPAIGLPFDLLFVE